MFSVREAGSDDAEAAVAAVRQSITESCVADHRGDTNTIEKWLLNKTVPHFLSWIANPDNFCVVAVENGNVQGVGLLRRVGEIVLLYLRPRAHRNGMGRAIYAELEKKAVEWGLREVTLESTDLARPFYEHLGFRSAGPEVGLFGVLRAFPYLKKLQPNPLMQPTGRERPSAD